MRLLLGNDTGQGRGHSEPLAACAARLGSAVSSIYAALPVLDDWKWHGATHVRGLQAPVWPKSVRADGRLREAGGRTLAHLLMALGLDESAGAACLEAWSNLIDLIKPDVIVADYAPGLTLAARGRVPVVSFGAGYCTPPSSEKQFPDMLPGVNLETIDEAPLLENINSTLRLAGLQPIERLTQCFEASDDIVLSFDVMDPYRAFRTKPNLPPFLSPPPAEIFGETRKQVDSGRPKLFVYLNEPNPRGKLILAALTKVDADIRVVMNWVDPDIERIVARHGVVIERGRLHPREIVGMDLVISFGSHRLVATCLAGGVPQLVFPTDAEKHCNVRALEAVGVVRTVPDDVVQIAELSAIIGDSLRDKTMRDAAISLAAPYRAQFLATDPIEEAVKRIKLAAG